MIPTLSREAGRRLGVAGMRALNRVDGAAGIDLLTRATSLLGDDPSALELEWALATAIKFSGDWVDASARLVEVAAKAARQHDRAIELRARVEQLWPELQEVVSMRRRRSPFSAKPSENSKRRATCSGSDAVSI